MRDVLSTYKSHRPQCSAQLIEPSAHTLLSQMTVPDQLPLTKLEDRKLRGTLRKIRNKASAQRSRRNKETYIDGLEMRVEECTRINVELGSKVRVHDPAQLELPCGCVECERDRICLGTVSCEHSMRLTARQTAWHGDALCSEPRELHFNRIHNLNLARSWPTGVQSHRRAQ